MKDYQLEAEAINSYLPDGIIQQIYNHNLINPSLADMAVLNVLAPNDKVMRPLVKKDAALTWGSAKALQAAAKKAGYDTYNEHMVSTRVLRNATVSRPTMSLCHVN